MELLTHKQHVTQKLWVGSRTLQSIGITPAGLRRFAPEIGGHSGGEMFAGKALPGAGWVINRPDGVMVIDVRLALETMVGAPIHLCGPGRLLALPQAMKLFVKGKLLDHIEHALAKQSI